MLRRLIKTTEEIANTIYAGKEPLENILADTEKSVFNLPAKPRGTGFRAHQQVAINVLEKIEDAYKNRGTVTVYLPVLLTWIISFPGFSLRISF